MNCDDIEINVKFIVCQFFFVLGPSSHFCCCCNFYNCHKIFIMSSYLTNLTHNHVDCKEILLIVPILLLWHKITPKNKTLIILHSTLGWGEHLDKNSFHKLKQKIQKFPNNMDIHPYNIQTFIMSFSNKKKLLFGVPHFSKCLSRGKKGYTKTKRSISVSKIL